METRTTRTTRTTSDERRLAFLGDVLARHARIAIVGAPGSGKTELARAVEDRPVFCTDSWMHLEWSEVPQAILDRVSPLDRFVLEGVQAARALRKGLEVDAVLLLDRIHRGGETPLGKGVAKVFRDWRNTHPTVPVLRPDLP